MAGISTLTMQEFFQTFFEKKKRAVVVWGVWLAFFLCQIVSMKSMQIFPEWLWLCISATFVVSLFVILGVNVKMFQMYIKLSENLELKQKNANAQLQLDLYKEHVKEKEITMQEFRQARHDLKHQLVYLMELLETKEYGEMEEYLKQLIDWKPLEGVVIADTGNSIIDVLINYKYAIMKEYNVPFHVKLEVPTSLPFDDADLCIVLGNALDNAIEGNLRGEVLKPYIDLKIKYNEGNLILILKNAFDGKVEKNHHGKILTRKKKTASHGIGINSMKKIVEKYHGFFDVKSENNEFCLKIILYLEPKRG